MNERPSVSRRILITGGSGFIGAHLVERLSRRGEESVVSVDIAPPRNPAQLPVWRKVSILDRPALSRVLTDFRPTHVVHLAARTDMEGASVDDYDANVAGTRLLLEETAAAGSVERLIVVSSQHVRRPGAPPPRGDEDFLPYLAYGESKVLTEQTTRQAALSVCWTIVRPTTVWGPGHEDLARGFWRTLQRGIYLHPRPDPVVRCYGYVKNVVEQMIRLLDHPAQDVHGRVFYLGDPCIRQEDWVDAFAQGLTGRPARRVPRSSLFTLALVGEGARRLGLSTPFYLSRYRNMTTGNVVPMEPTMDLLGAGPYSLEQGVEESVAWLLRGQSERP
jgi:nucleoside-diphosphate-sugar epimerase